ncbi:MAG: hypothetical protein ACYS99_19080, partial [Planctomycetota bacterium]
MRDPRYSPWRLAMLTKTDGRKTMFSRWGVPVRAAIFLVLLVGTGALEETREGNLVVWGSDEHGQIGLGVTYTQVVGGGGHSLALRSDGGVLARGNNDYGQCDVPALPPGVTYTQVAGGYYHSLALRSDGTVDAWGRNGDGQCTVPDPPEGVTYTQVAG